MHEEFSIISTAIVLFFVFDPIGNMPLIMSVLKDVDKSKHRPIIIREMFIGLAILFIFLFFGERFLSLFGLQKEAITIAGGIIFFIIGLHMIFPSPDGKALFGSGVDNEPFIVPIAMPLIAGPAALATLLVLAKTNSSHMLELGASLFLAWLGTFLILFFAPSISKTLKKKGLTALEKLMGMLLLMISVQMFIDGVMALLHK